MEKQDNVIYIGAKSLSVYNFAIHRELEKGNEVILKTRGRLTSVAVNIASYFQYKGNAKIVDTKISGSNFKTDEKERFVPEIEIRLVKS